MDEWTACPLQFHQIDCFCASVAVFQLLRPSVLTLYEVRKFMSRTHLTESTSWRFPWKTPLETLPQIFYPNAIRNMGLCCLSWVFHCLDTRWPPAPFCERVEPDIEFCLNFVNSVTLFYKSFVLPCLLGYWDIFDCPKCNKAILE